MARMTRQRRFSREGASVRLEREFPLHPLQARSKGSSDFWFLPCSPFRLSSENATKAPFQLKSREERQKTR